MKLKKIITSIVLIFAIVISVPSMAHASSANLSEPIDGSDYSKKTFQNPSTKTVYGGRVAKPEHIKISQEKQKNNSTKSIESKTRATLGSWVQLSNMSNYFYYFQETDYSCGPACIKMALKYLKPNVNYEESTIRNACYTSTTNGTYLYDMVTYINGEQTSYNYSSDYSTSFSSFISNLTNSISVWDIPPIVDITENQSTGWPFNLYSHYIEIYSAMNDQSCFMVTDPYAGYVSRFNPNRWYSVNAHDLFWAYRPDVGYMY